MVDDEEFCIATMRGIFESCGFNCELEVDFCIDGQESLDKVIDAYDHGMTYGIIFTDFNMPVLDGIEATRQIRNHLSTNYKLKRED